MSNRIYIGSDDGKAHRVVDMYIGVKGLAKRVRYVYLGINGKAKLVYRYPYVYEDTVNRFLTVPDGAPTSDNGYYMLNRGAMCSINDKYALYGGYTCTTNDVFTDTVKVSVISESLTIMSQLTLSKARHNLRAASNDNYAIFAGGEVKTGKGTNSSYERVSNLTFTNIADAFNKQLTRVGNVSVLSSSRSRMFQVSMPKYAMFAGGYTLASSGSSFAYASTIDYYDTALTRTNSALSVYKYEGASTYLKSGKYAMIMPGHGNNSTSGNMSGMRINMIDGETLSAYKSDFSENRLCMVVGTVADTYIICGGGYYGNNQYTDMFSFNSNMTKTAIGSLNTFPGYGGAFATSVGTDYCVVFPTWYNDDISSSKNYGKSTVYDSNLTIVQPYNKYGYVPVHNSDSSTYGCNVAKLGKYTVKAGMAGGVISGGYDKCLTYYYHP